MKYQLEFFEGEDELLKIHVDKRLTRETIVSFEGPGQKSDLGESQPVYVRKIFGIIGIKMVSIEPFSLLIEKGTVFQWKKLLPKIILVLEKHLSHGKLIPTGDDIKRKLPASTTEIHGISEPDPY